MLRLIYLLIIGLVAGWLGIQIMGAGKKGVLVMMVVGVVGSYLGGLAIWLLGFSANGLIAEIITATLGAVLFIWLLRYFGG